MKWKKVCKKKVEVEFRRLLNSVASSNGSDDLIDICEDLITIENKRSFVESWHEQDIPDEEELTCKDCGRPITNQQGLCDRCSSGQHYA